jgi:rod shape-determining protein MreC
MGRLFLFVYQYRAFFTFLSLEILCAFLIIQNNRYQSSKYFNTANAAVANLASTSNGIKEYFGLREINRELAEENARLHQYVDRQTNTRAEVNLAYVDTTRIKTFTYTSAKVINNSINLSKNYLTINKGLSDGIAPGMAVISSLGVVGKVKTVCRSYFAAQY